jgi:hypothetical protein
MCVTREEENCLSERVEDVCHEGRGELSLLKRRRCVSQGKRRNVSLKEKKMCVTGEEDKCLSEGKEDVCRKGGDELSL